MAKGSSQSKVYPPGHLPVYQHADPSRTTFFGRVNTDYRDKNEPIFGIYNDDRMHHMYMIGKSGTGKTKLMELMIRQDIAYGNGVCVFDPQGELYEDLLDFLPTKRIKDVVLIDPTDRDWPVKFNPLADVDPDHRHKTTQSLIQIFSRQFGSGWSARLEHLFRFLCLALLDHPSATLFDMMRMLREEGFRGEVTEHIEDDMIRDFWANEYVTWAERYDAEAVVPLINKLSQFLSDPLLRNIFSSTENEIDFSDCIGNKKIVLVNMAAGRLGRANAELFGSLLVMMMNQAGMAIVRERQKTDPFYVYVDDVHYLMSPIFLNLFLESRKYNFSFTVAHQYMAQLSTEEQSTVLGNSGTLIMFRLSGEDAIIMEKETVPTYRRREIMNLGMREFFVKLSIHGTMNDPFPAETLNVLPTQHDSHRDEALQASRERYARQIGTGAIQAPS